MSFPGTTRVEHVLGLPVNVDVRTALPARELAPLLDDAYAWLRRVDEVFGEERRSGRFGALAGGEAPAADRPPEVADALTRRAGLRAATGGLPDDEAALAVYVRGWAVERISRALSVAGAVDHCVNAGSVVRVRGSARPGARWRIGVRDPRDEQVCKVLFAHDLAVATVGGGGEEPGAGVRRPAETGSVTVVGPDLGAAVAYATAMRAMEPARARRFADRLGAAGPYDVLIVREDGRSAGTPGLAEYAAAAGTGLAV